METTIIRVNTVETHSLELPFEKQFPASPETPSLILREVLLAGLAAKGITVRADAEIVLETQNSWETSHHVITVTWNTVK